MSRHPQPYQWLCCQGVGVDAVGKQLFIRQSIPYHCTCNVAKAPIATEFAIGFEYGNHIEIEPLAQVLFEYVKSQQSGCTMVEQCIEWNIAQCLQCLFQNLIIAIIFIGLFYIFLSVVCRMKYI